VTSVRVVCAHDCPDMCSLIASVEDGKIVRVQGDPNHPYTAGFACGKVNRDADLVNSPERIATPLKRTGPKGSGQFKPITWDEALDEIAAKWKAIIAESGPLALLGYAYSAHQGLMNRGLVNGLFHALGSSRLQAGTVCDTCCEEAWNVTVGPVGGADPEDVVHSDLVISWGADLAATNVHYWSLVEHAKRKRPLPVIVIDPRRTRSAKAADLYLPIRIGTDAALALGVMHILVRDRLVDRNYLSNYTLGFETVERDILPKFSPAKVAEITGLAVADIETLASMYGRAKAAMIRLGEGMTRLAAGGQALRTVALLPGVTGHYAVRGGGALLLTAASCDLNYNAVRKPSGPAASRMVNHLRLGEALLDMKDPPLRALYISANNPAVTCPEVLACSMTTGVPPPPSPAPPAAGAPPAAVAGAIWEGSWPEAIACCSASTEPGAAVVAGTLVAAVATPRMPSWRLRSVFAPQSSVLPFSSAMFTAPAAEVVMVSSLRMVSPTCKTRTVPSAAVALASPTTEVTVPSTFPDAAIFVPSWGFLVVSGRQIARVHGPHSAAAGPTTLAPLVSVP